jgi:NAD(P)-dependent dehydrogenase (short-subunit alcohol dehydrogenase family)
MSATETKGTALITGASSGMGAIYADRLAKRGYDLILVARNKNRLTGLAERLKDETGRSVETIGYKPRRNPTPARSARSWAERLLIGRRADVAMVCARSTFERLGATPAAPPNCNQWS